MILLFIRILSLVAPFVYFFALSGARAFPGAWFWFLILILAEILIYFLLLALKLKRKRVWYLLVYCEIFAALGFFYMMFLSRPPLINTFIVIWSALVWLYLEAVLNYFFRTEKFFLLELKNITAYLNLIMVFFLSFSALYSLTFLDFAWWWVFPTYLLVMLILLFDRFLVYEFSWKENFVHTGVLGLVMIELILILSWWPVSNLVSAALLATFYYLMSVFALLNYRGELNQKIMSQHLVYAAALLAVVLATAQWF